MNNKYNEIMDLPHHVSGTRPQMPMSDRAVNHRSDHEGTQLDYRVLSEAANLWVRLGKNVLKRTTSPERA